MEAAVPGGIRAAEALDLPAAATEERAARELRALAAANTPREPMIGLGYHGTITPAVIRRNVLENPAWYTAYTPYQPEISQGRLEALLNFQTMVADLTGLPTANASLLDEGTAAAEAMTLVRRANKKAAGPFVVDADALPQTIAVVRTRAQAMGIEVVVADLADGLPEGDLCGVLVQYPGADGAVRDPRAVIAEAHERGAMAVVAADLLALTLLESPGDPRRRRRRRLHPALRRAAGLRRPARRLHGGARGPRAAPARPPGRRLRRRGRPAGLPARAADPRAAHPPRQGDLQHLHRPGAARRDGLDVRRLPRPRRAADDRRGAPTATPAVLAAALRAGRRRAAARGVLRHRHRAGPGPGRRRSSTRPATAACTCASSTPTTSGSPPPRPPAGRTSRPCSRRSGSTADVDAVDAPVGEDLPAALARTTTYLTHPVFNSHRSETAMLRYLRRLSDRDYALDRGMIPLGSCTMKLNATTEMEPVSLPGFADLHPFAPAEDARGYRRLVGELEAWLAEVTGYDRVSIQPNAGSQGELAGLLAIRAYHRGQRRRGSATSA